MFELKDYPDHFKKSFHVSQQVDPEVIRKRLKLSLEKGLIDQDLFNKAEDQLDQLVKAKGEGSKGGHVIGHTANGKAIYEHHLVKHYSHNPDLVIKHHINDHGEASFKVGHKEGTGPRNGESHQHIGGNEKTGYWINTYSGNINNPRTEGSAVYPWNHHGDDEGKKKYGHYRYTEEGVKKVASGYGIHAKGSEGAKTEEAQRKAATDQKKKQIEHHYNMHKFHNDMIFHAKETAKKYGVNDQEEANSAHRHHWQQAMHHLNEKERLENEK